MILNKTMKNKYLLYCGFLCVSSSQIYLGLFYLKNSKEGPGKRAQGLRALPTLAEKLGFSSQHPHSGSQPESVTPALGDARFSSSFKGTSHAHSAHTYKQVNTHIHAIKISKSPK